MVTLLSQVSLSGIILFLACFSLASPPTNNSIRLREGPEIVKVKPGVTSTLGVADGMRHCGGPGRPVQIRYAPCKGEIPCKTPADGQMRRSEFEFIPSQNVDGLTVSLRVRVDNVTKILYEGLIANSMVEAGETYWLIEYGSPKETAINKFYTFQYNIFRLDNGELELCSEADFFAVGTNSTDVNGSDS